LVFIARGREIESINDVFAAAGDDEEQHQQR